MVLSCLDRFCSSSLPSDITLIVDGVNFHIHKVFSVSFLCGGKDILYAMADWAVYL